MNNIRLHICSGNAAYGEAIHLGSQRTPSQTDVTKCIFNEALFVCVVIASARRHLILIIPGHFSA